jgi:hypothetical protein
MRNIIAYQFIGGWAFNQKMSQSHRDDTLLDNVFLHKQRPVQNNM